MPTQPPLDPPRRIGDRALEKARLVPLLLASVALHVLLALALACVLAHPQSAPPEDTLDLGVDVTLGEAVQELIVTEPSNPPASIEPTPPTPPLPPEPATSEPPPPTPALETPEFVEPKPEPKNKTLPKPVKRTTPRPASAPPNARVGSIAREGVAGGNVTEGHITGTPGGQKLGNQGWRTPKPPYPTQARLARITGSGVAHITTNASGDVVSCTVTGLPGILDSNTRAFARANWKGPSNAIRTVPVIYRLE